VPGAVASAQTAPPPALGARAARPVSGPDGLRALVRDPAAGTTTVASPPAPLGSCHTGAVALTPADRLRSLAPPAW
jgi:hypothetical protein